MVGVPVLVASSSVRSSRFRAVPYQLWFYQVEKATADVRAREMELERLAATLADQTAAATSERAALEARDAEVSSKMILAEELQVSKLRESEHACESHCCTREQTINSRSKT